MQQFVNLMWSIIQQTKLWLPIATPLAFAILLTVSTRHQYSLLEKRVDVVKNKMMFCTGLNFSEGSAWSVITRMGCQSDLYSTRLHDTRMKIVWTIIWLRVSGSKLNARKPFRSIAKKIFETIWAGESWSWSLAKTTSRLFRCGACLMYWELMTVLTLAVYIISISSTWGLHQFWKDKQINFQRHG